MRVSHHTTLTTQHPQNRQASDSLPNNKDILTKHKTLLANYLYVNFDLFFSKYNTILVQSESYVTKRQSIKLLGEILLDRANYEVMMAYVDRGANLKLCMNLLKDERKMVQYEGFHVFKVGCALCILGFHVICSFLILAHLTRAPSKDALFSCLVDLSPFPFTPFARKGGGGVGGSVVELKSRSLPPIK